MIPSYPSSIAVLLILLNLSPSSLILRTLYFVTTIQSSKYSEIPNPFNNSFLLIRGNVPLPSLNSVRGKKSNNAKYASSV